MKKQMIALAVAGAVLLPTAAFAAPEDSGSTGVRKADFISALSDTRATGHYEFLAEGIHVYTESNTSTDKVAEYFSVAQADGKFPGLPTESKLTWYGTSPQPGVQIVFDVDNIAGNGNDYNVLVGEPVYGVNANGTYADWWLSNGSSADAKAKAPVNGGGSGSQWHGSLTQWATALPNAKTSAAGFSLGSGVKGDGIITAIQFGKINYVPTNEAKPTVVTPPAPAKAVDVTGKVTIKKAKSKHKATVKFLSNATPTGAVEGKPLSYSIRINNRPVASFTEGAGETAKYKFSAGGIKKHIEVFLNGQVVAKKSIR